MSDRGLAVSDIVAQLVADARRHKGLSTDELADRAGMHGSYVDLLERRSRQPTLAAATSLAEALGLSLSELVAEAEQDAGNGYVPAVELLPAPPRRYVEAGLLREDGELEAATGLTAPTVGRAIELAYRKLDIVDEQLSGSGSRPLAGLLGPADLASLVANVLAAGIDRASNGLYVQNDPGRSPSLLPLGPGHSELEVKAALETGHPARGSTGAYLAARYVLVGSDGTFTRGKDARGDTVAVWEVRFAVVGDEDFHNAARLKKDVHDRMELVYYDPSLLPYAKATGVYSAQA